MLNLISHDTQAQIQLIMAYNMDDINSRYDKEEA